MNLTNTSRAYGYKIPEPSANHIPEYKSVQYAA